MELGHDQGTKELRFIRDTGAKRALLEFKEFNSLLGDPEPKVIKELRQTKVLLGLGAKGDQGDWREPRCNREILERRN
jgi:hypothetical protein